MDLDAMRLLQELPDDLKYRGWEWMRLESSVHKTVGARWFVAVYARPFERGIDQDHMAHHHKGGRFVRVSTNQDRSQSWEEAYQDALRLMRAADARRSDAE